MPDGLDRGTVIQLAAKASVDPRTIMKAAKGKPVRGLSGSRAIRALRDAGLLPLPNREGSSTAP